MTARRGLVHVYTGEGKGKTTAAFGLALRAVGQGLKVAVFQFMKETSPLSGEVEAVQAHLPKDKITVARFGDSFINPQHEPIESIKERVNYGWQEAKKALDGNTCDILILDEINLTIDLGLLPVKSVLEAIRTKPAVMEIVLTGRNAPQELIDIADYVTSFTLVKHPFDRQVPMRKGIEY